MTDYVTTYYVKASVATNGVMASCSYFTNPKCTDPATLPLSVSISQGYCDFIQGDGSDLVLLGATYKTLGHAPVMTDGNFAAATNGTVTVVMPKGTEVTKGVVLIFSDPGKVETLYPSSDPTVVNGQEP
ncbi:hypothetical protein [Roseateles sp.]|uniref:hypothetical protein n=1 Tax=Roseateles sp. TaxID=1971397 RepID=UPI003961955F